MSLSLPTLETGSRPFYVFLLSVCNWLWNAGLFNALAYLLLGVKDNITKTYFCKTWLRHVAKSWGNLGVALGWSSEKSVLWVAIVQVFSSDKDWKQMNGPRRTACFAKGMSNYTFFTLDRTWFEYTDNPVSRRCQTRHGRTDGLTDNVQIFVSLRLLTSLCETIRGCNFK